MVSAKGGAVTGDIPRNDVLSSRTKLTGISWSGEPGANLKIVDFCLHNLGYRWLCEGLEMQPLDRASDARAEHLSA